MSSSIKSIISSAYNFMKKGYDNLQVQNTQFHDIIEILPWNNNVSRWKKRNLSDIDLLIIHQSEGHVRDMGFDVDCQNTENINRYHTGPNHISNKGLCHIAYTISIENSGRIELCNYYDDITASAGKFNKRSLNIVVCGNFEGPSYHGTTSNPIQSPSKYQIDRLEKAIKKILQDPQFPNLKSWSQVVGHCTVNPTSRINCPGIIIMENINKWKVEHNCDETK